MEDNRTGQRSAAEVPVATLLAAEALRNAAAVGLPAAPAKPEERLPVFWRVFGATLLSIAALIVITLCQHFSNSLNELRAELGHLCEDLHKDLARLSESHGRLIPKEEFNTRLTSVWNSLKDLQALSVTVAALKEKTLVREEQQRAQDERKELVRELQQLRERLALLEGRQDAAAAGKHPPTPANEANLNPPPGH
jgi:hypothetical protein